VFFKKSTPQKKEKRKKKIKKKRLVDVILQGLKEGKNGTQIPQNQFYKK